jgi:hypothetical protein
MRPPTHSHAGYRSPEQRRAEYEAKRRRNVDYQARRRVYNSKAWAQLKDTVRLQQPWCESCLARGIQRPWTDLHHRIDIAQGGAPFDIENVVGLCHSCHAKHTAATAGGWSSAKDAKGEGGV